MSRVVIRHESQLQRAIKLVSDVVLPKSRNRAGGAYILLDTDDKIRRLDIWAVSSRTDDGVLDYSLITVVIKRLAKSLLDEGNPMRLHHVVRGDQTGNEKASLHHVGLAFDFSLLDRRALTERLIREHAAKAGVKIRYLQRYDTAAGGFMHLEVAPSLVKMDKIIKAWVKK